jgi:hypothetical protein
MKKIYFALNPMGPIYYVCKPDNWDEDDGICVGYDGHRNEYIRKSQFSENHEDIKKILEKNKQHLVSKKYEELLRLINTKFEEEDTCKFDEW